MITQKEFRAAAERICGDESLGNDYVALLDKEAPGWRELPPEIVQSELAAIQRRMLTEADQALDTMNELDRQRQVEQDERDVGPDLGGSPMEMGP